MSHTWRSDEPEIALPKGVAAWIRVILRGSLLGAVTFGCLGLLLAVRLIERPLFGLRRPITPHITQFVCRSAFRILGMGHVVEGKPMSGMGAIVANHASWLDIFTLNAAERVWFVSKAEVRAWPGIGWLARATGTLFINRDRREAKAHTEQLSERLHAGQRLLFFPEGTSTDGSRVIPFKTTLFAAFFDQRLKSDQQIQPVTVIYHAPPDEDGRFYGWWGDMSFGAHLLRVLAAPRQGRVEVVFHAPVRVADFTDRKALARHAETVVRTAFEARR